MTRDGNSRTLRRGVVALLAAWMAVFAVLAAVHNHGILGFTARHATLDQSVAGPCGSPRVPPVWRPTSRFRPPTGRFILSAPVETSGIVPVCRLQHVRPASIIIRSSALRPPPSISQPDSIS